MWKKLIIQQLYYKMIFPFLFQLIIYYTFEDSLKILYYFPIFVSMSRGSGFLFLKTGTKTVNCKVQENDSNFDSTVSW